ncbi:TetR/AcrR family transcriptional regulator [Cnuibacter sp. UC19_7]|uniref:TetR/AcrR family transcriptional regulator n=1 Tax=Cnuibacter sp. UC19_7 TaxID=3350166 RepID=UPI003670B760
MSIDEPPAASGRPRDPEVERSILTAAQDLLIESGYPGTTIAAVAARAHCGKSAIYRRWSTKAELVVAAVSDLQVPVEVPDTGDLRDDLLGAALHFASTDERSGPVLASLLGEIGRDRELYEVAYRLVGGPPVAAIETVIRRAIERGGHLRRRARGARRRHRAHGGLREHLAAEALARSRDRGRPRRPGHAAGTPGGMTRAARSATACPATASTV